MNRTARTREFSSQLNLLLIAIREKAMRQFDYNEETNIPKAIIQPEESVSNAMQHGFSAGWNAVNGYCCDRAYAVAYEILEDANCHTECSALHTARAKYEAANS